MQRKIKNFSFNELLSIAFILSFCSFSYELLIAKTLVNLTGNTILWESITIGIYIFSLGFGTLISKYFIKGNIFPKLFLLENMLSIFGSVCVTAIIFFNIYYYYLYLSGRVERLGILDITKNITDLVYYSRDLKYISFSLFVFLSQSVTFFIGMLSGLEIPFLLKAAKDMGLSHKNNFILGISFLGTLLSTIVFSFILLPNIGIVSISVFIGSINLLICFFLFLRKSAYKSNKVSISIILLSILVISSVIRFSEKIESISLKTSYFALNYFGSKKTFADFIADINKFPEVERITTLYQNIDIMPSPLGEYKKFSDKDFQLFIDGHFQFDTFTEEFYHAGLVKAPAALLNIYPENILVLGAGDGFLIRDLLQQYPKAKKITHIEIDPEMVGLAKTFPALVLHNKNSLSNHHVQTITGDAFYFIRNSKEQYDAIYIDFPHPFNYDISRLYSIEFFSHLAKRISPNGFAVIDSPLFRKEEIKSYLIKGQNSPAERMILANNVILNTLRKTNLKFYPYIVGAEGFILITNPDLKVSWNEEEKQRIIYNSLGYSWITENLLYEFPYEINDRYINSVFSPKFLAFKDVRKF